MVWKLAPCLSALRDETDARWPDRSRVSDGTIGDQAHRARISDHNPDRQGFVNALDLTNDPDCGFDIHTRIREWVSCGEERIKYAISDGQIWNPTLSAWATYTRLRSEGHSRRDAARMALPGWRTYTGSNPHVRHGHISAKSGDQHRYNSSTWYASCQLKAEEIMAQIPGAVGFCILHNDDLVITTSDGAIFHFDHDGVPDETDYLGAYNGHPDLWGPPGSTPTLNRACVGVYAINRSGKAVPDGHVDATGYCQVFNDSSRYRWHR